MPIDTEPTEKPIPPTPVSPTSFTTNTPQVIAGNADTQIFPSVGGHLTSNEIKEDGPNWVKILGIIAFLLILLDAGVYGYNIWRGVENPDLLAPITSLLNR